MKRILITGADSYIGTSFETFINGFNGYSVDTLDMRNADWKKYDFSKYDVVFHVAGIAHSDTKGVSDEVRQMYYQINTELTIETAKKAKADGVKQFIFMSSIIVYGSKNECITKESVPVPDNFYGDSKLRADVGIHQIEDNDFNVVSIRPPMIYGKGSKGNYPKLAKLARRLPFFPDYENKRSMLYIENLCSFIKLLIDNSEKGYFYPQNSEYVKTADMVEAIASTHGKKIHLTKVFNFLVSALKKQTIVKKVFGNMYYDKSVSEYAENYCIVDFEESIRRTENA